MNQGHQSSGKKVIFGGILFLVIGMFSTIALMPQLEQAQFSEVVAHVNSDPRNQAPITYATPNFTSQTGWSIGLYEWKRNGVIDWNQVEYFLNELEYYNKTVYRCDFYRAHPDETPWYLFLWFQYGDYQYKFLYMPFGFLRDSLP